MDVLKFIGRRDKRKEKIRNFTKEFAKGRIDRKTAAIIEGRRTRNQILEDYEKANEARRRKLGEELRHDSYKSQPMNTESDYEHLMNQASYAMRETPQERKLRYLKTKMVSPHFAESRKEAIEELKKSAYWDSVPKEHWKEEDLKGMPEVNVSIAREETHEPEALHSRLGMTKREWLDKHIKKDKGLYYFDRGS